MEQALPLRSNKTMGDSKNPKLDFHSTSPATKIVMHKIDNFFFHLA